MSTSPSKPIAYKLDHQSPLLEDLTLLGIDVSSFQNRKGKLIQSTIIALFEHRSSLLLYVYLPKEDQQLNDITINKVNYGVTLVETNGFVHKYVVAKAFKSGKLTITSYGFVDQTMTRSTYSVHEEHVFGLLHGQYYYDSKKYHSTQLIGELFYELIDMRTLQDKVEHFLSRNLRMQDIRFHQSPYAKLYYVAFNLFDSQTQTPFLPEDIVEMKVRYDAHRYVYQNKRTLTSETVDPLKAGETFSSVEEQTIEKENRLIERGEKSDWNVIQNFFSYHSYRYDAIFRFQDHPLKQHKDFEYALFIGPKKGYRYSKEKIKKLATVSYDFEETTLKNISIYHLTYQEKGLRYSIPVSSLIYESNKKQRLPRFRNQLRHLLRSIGRIASFPFKFVFGASGVLMKIITFLVKHWKLVLVLLVLAFLGYLSISILNIIN